MTVRSFLSTLVGAAMVLLGFAWGTFDASQHLGRVGTTTLVGSLALTAAGGFLMSKRKTLALFTFVLGLGRRAMSLKVPLDGSDDDAA